MPSVSPQEARQELETVAGSAGFTGAGRLVPFLRFVVERTLAGEPVKEALIGVEVFGRPPDYDPRVDPIVRVEARRLRSRLAEYYEGAGAADPVIIQLPKGAYVPVFLARGAAGSAQPARPPGAAKLRGLRFGELAGLGIGLVVLAAIFFFTRWRTPAPQPVLAVLPFVNMSDDRADDAFSDGLTEELIDRLSKVEGLRVVARTSVYQFKGRAQDLREVGRKLNATAVLEGSVRRSGDRLRIAAKLIDVSDGLHMWSETYERRMSEVFTIQDDIARSIASALRVELRVGFSGQSPPPTANVAAYDLYLKGKGHLNHDALGGLELAADSFERAIAADPGFAAAHAQLAVDYGLLAYYQLRPAAEAWPRARAEAERAVALNPKLAAGHAALGFALGLYDWKWAEAERSLRRAVALDGDSADAHVALAVAALVPTGRLAEASGEYARALELDPQSYLANVGAAFAFLAQGRYPEAIPQYQKAAEINPSHADTQWDLGMAYAFAGRKEEAERQFRLGGQIRSGGAWKPGPIEYALLGDEAAARRAIAGWRGFTAQRPMFIAYCYGVLGDANQTSAWLEKAYAGRDPQIVWLKVDPRFAKVRSDARVAALIAKLGL
jgi:TolB-like protein/tetratricopeptide (TPR) repeat protein